MITKNEQEEKMITRKTIKSAFESMLFVWGEPLDIKLAADVLDIDKKEAYECFLELKEEYEQAERGIRIREINKSFQFVTSADNSEFLECLCTPVKKKRLSGSALEVLAIVAYKQPVTRGEIESVRGIRCDRIIENLVRKDLITGVGRSSGIGRPVLYGTTDNFLKKFGFESIKDLPEIDEFEEGESISANVSDISDIEENSEQIAMDLSE